MSSPRDLRLRLCRYDGSRGSPEPSASPPTRQCLRRDLRLEGLADIFDTISDFGNASEFGLKGLPTTSASPLLCLEGLTATFGCYFNLYVIYIDYFHYMRSLSHELPARGAGGVLEDQFILEDGALPEAQRRSHSPVKAQKRSYPQSRIPEDLKLALV